MTFEPPFRWARATDSRELAELINLAGEGIPGVMWEEAAGPGETALDVGAKRAARSGVNFSFENAVVAEAGGAVAAMLLGYPIDDEDPGDLLAVPELVRPLVRLECKAPGTWYINAVAVLDTMRGQGLGTRLLEIANDLARAAGRAKTSLIVDSGNEGAVRLYDRLGFKVAAREPLITHPRLSIAGEWLLMTKDVG